MTVKKCGAFTQADKILITNGCAKTCAYFLPFYEVTNFVNVSGVLLDLHHFSKSINFDKYQVEKNEFIFEKYTAMFQYETEIIRYGLRKTPTEQCSRISIKNANNLDEISPAETQDIKEFLNESGAEHEAVLLANVLYKHDSSESLHDHEHNKLVRVTILYTLGFFALTSVTFFIIYLA